MQTRPDKWQFYLDVDKKWRWTRIAPNGEIVASSSQSYTRKQNAMKNAVRNGLIKFPPREKPVNKTHATQTNS